MPFLVTLTLLLASLEQNPNPVKNPDLEEGSLGGQPPGWLVPAPIRDAGYSVTLTDESPATGKRCAVIASSTPSQAFGNAMQSLDAAPYRGHRVTYRARVRASPGSRAQLWLRVDRPGGAMGAFDNMGDRPITSSTWAEYRIEADIATDALAIAFGVMLPGEGRIWFDSASLEFTALEPRPADPPRAVAGRGLDNLVAFTRLFGYVRYFHPSDQAAAANWDRLAIDGVRVVEKATTPHELAAALEGLFRPIAPTVRLFTGPKPPPLPTDLVKPKVGGPRVIAWKHTGLAQGQAQFQIYSSVRETRDLVGGAAPSDVDPGKPVVLDLPGGVRASVPIALWSDGTGTLPKSPAGSPPRPMSMTAADRSTRIADIVIAWNIFQHFYPYFDVVSVDWPAVLRESLASAAVADEQGFLQVLRKFVAAIQDGHGRIAGGATPPGSLPFTWDWIENNLVITHAPGGPNGLRRGDVVVTIDRQPAAAALAALERTISGATPQWLRFRALADLGMGGPDSEVVLQVRTGSEPVREVRLRRGVQRVSEPRPEAIGEVRTGVFYVDLDRATEQQWKNALPSVAEAKAVVFDLRGYPRMSPVFIQHIIDSPVQSARWQVPVITRPDRQMVTYLESGRWNLQPLAPRLKGRLAFVTDGRAISYAESCLGIVEHYKLAAIVGAPTAGTNGNVNPFKLPGGYTVSWTGMKVLKHDGSRHHGVGILPTIPVSRTIAGVTAGRDELLERAIEAVTR
jgi:C-terminal processing protease CtpA/Prc